MSYHYSYALDEGLDILTGLLSSIPSFAISIACYVLTGLGLYTLAKRRGIGKPWLAWIPVVNVWIIGSLSDQYRYVVKRQVKSKRKVLLVLNIILTVLCTAFFATVIGLVFSALSASFRGAPDQVWLEALIAPMLGMMGLFLPLIGVAIAEAVISYMALYDIYTSCDPDNSVLFLVLSIVFSVTQPFFLFFNRKKDNGMPPRKPEPTNYIPPRQSAQESRENGPDYL